MSVRDKSYTLNMEGITEAVLFIQNSLAGIANKEAVHTAMLAEDIISAFIEKSPGRRLDIRVGKRFGDYYVKIFAEGAAYNPLEDIKAAPLPEGLEHMEEGLTRLLMSNYSGHMEYARNKTWNVVVIRPKESGQKALYLNLGALALAVGFGAVANLLFPETVVAIISTWFLEPIKTIFMSAMSFVTVPVVFFSIVTCIGGFANLSELGRIGGKVMLLFFFTSAMAILVGFGTSLLFQPGNGITIGTTSDYAAAEVATPSVIDSLTAIVPSNIVAPFANADMLQIIFVAVFLGIAMALTGDAAKPLAKLFDSLNRVFARAIMLIIKILPLATFAAMALITMSVGLQTLVALAALLGCFVFAVVVMIGFYCLLMTVLSHKNPLQFLKKAAPLMLMAFSLSSSNATMPVTMQTCEEKLGVNPKVSSFAIQLGATINMDGTCIYMMLASTFLMRAYGMEITQEAVLSLFVLTFILSIGMPGIPGSGLVCLSLIVPQVGIPIESIGIILGIDRVASMLRASNNVLGDMAVTVSVAKTEKLLDDKIYDA